MQLIVLSAGRGSRLPHKIRNKPKCLVELNSKPLILYNKDFFSLFKKKIIVAGYKHKSLDKISREIGFTKILNKNFSSTNMVYSLFLTKKNVSQDVVIVYGDILFDKSVYNIVKLKKNVLPVNVNWLKNWKKRMSFKEILNDAESLKVKKGKILEIGTSLDKYNLPKYQFMGIIKLKKNSYLKCFHYFKKLKNYKIDMTSFLNLCIKNKIIALNALKYKKYWFEIDNKLDFKFTEREIKRW